MDQTLGVLLRIQGISTLDQPALGAIERHFSSIVVREVDNLNQSQEFFQTSSDEGEITSSTIIPLVFKRAYVLCYSVQAPSDAKILRCGHAMCRACVQARSIWPFVRNIPIHQSVARSSSSKK